MPVPKPSASDAEHLLQTQFKQAVDAIQQQIDRQLTASIMTNVHAVERKVIVDPYERQIGQPFRWEALLQALESYDDWETTIKDTVIRHENGIHAGWEVTFK